MVSSFITNENANPVNPTEKLQATASTQMVLPQVQIYCHAASEDFPKAFQELTFRNEGFKPVPLLCEAPVAFKELLVTPSSIQGDWR